MAPTISTSPKHNVMICVPAARSHLNKKRREACKIESSRHPPQQLPRSINLPVSHENADTDSVSYSGTRTRTPLWVVTAIVTITFTYLFHSACSVVPLEVYCVPLIGGNANVPMLPAACRWREVSAMFCSGGIIFWHGPPARFRFRFLLPSQNIMQ